MQCYTNRENIFVVVIQCFYFSFIALVVDNKLKMLQVLVNLFYHRFVQFSLNITTGTQPCTQSNHYTRTRHI